MAEASSVFRPALLRASGGRGRGLRGVGGKVPSRVVQMALLRNTAIARASLVNHR